ncbi:hypothetical protein [Micrococcoides hystricis]|uniref:LPXTG cell wall anchor domain-containing protein n=1 Tax=Micrococcoides hystricis TaxID=1572761 RepID=A0ABV6PCU2_9MICC
MSQKTTLRALLAAGVASALVAASATGAFAEPTDPAAPASDVDASVGLQDGEGDNAAAADVDNDADTVDAPEIDEEAADNSDAADEGPADEESEVVSGDDQVEDDSSEPEGDVASVEGGEEKIVDEVVKPVLENSVEGDLHAEAEWTVTKKTVKDVSKVSGPAGSKVQVAYQVDLSAWGIVTDVLIEGTLSVKNPNKAAQTYTLEAFLKNGSTKETAKEISNSVCAFTGKDADPNTPGHQVKIDAGQELDFTYECTSEGGWFEAAALDSVPYNFWTFLRAITLGLNEEGIAEIATKVDTSHVNVHNAELDVYDVNLSDVEGDAVHLGTVAATDGSGQFKYVMNLTVPADKCLDYVNAVYAVGDFVWVEELEGELDILTDQATVTACPEAPATTKPTVKTAAAVTAATTTGEGELAKTGAESPMLGGIGVGLIGLGALAFGLSRRARKA